MNTFQIPGQFSMGTELANLGQTAAGMVVQPPQVPQVRMPNVAPSVTPTGAGVRGTNVPAGAAGGAAPGTQTGFMGKIGGLEGLASIAQGLASLGQVYGAIQGVRIAKDQLALSREAYQTNLANTRKSYNTALEDRITSRHVMEGRSSADTESYLAKNKL